MTRSAHSPEYAVSDEAAAYIADALMQLGTLFIRTDQPSLARRAFRQCQELDGGSKWRWEIRQAMARLGGEGPPSQT